MERAALLGIPLKGDIFKQKDNKICLAPNSVIIRVCK